MYGIWRLFLTATIESPTWCYLSLETDRRRRGLETPGVSRESRLENPRQAEIKIRGLVEYQRLHRFINKVSGTNPIRWREIYALVDGMVPR